MKEANKIFLDQNRDCYDEVVRVETAQKASLIAGDLLRVLNEEFLPGYVYSGTCGPCLFDMVKILYRHYDSWIKEQPIIVHASFPMNDKPEDENIHARKNYHRK